MIPESNRNFEDHHPMYHHQIQGSNRNFEDRRRTYRHRHNHLHRHNHRHLRSPGRGSLRMLEWKRSSGEHSQKRYWDHFESHLSEIRRQENVREIPQSNDSIERSENFYRKPYKRVRTSESIPQMPEPIYSSRQRRKGFGSDSLRESANNKNNSYEHSDSEIVGNDRVSRVLSGADNGLSEEKKEHIRISKVYRKKDFIYLDRIDGKPTNVLQGVELHTRVFNAEEQKKIVERIYELQRKGRKGLLRERTYSEPRKWMRGKGRVTLQFGCCYNYAVDKNGNLPGIIRGEEVDPIPPLFKQIIKRMVRWNVIPPTCIPNSCIVNIYEEGDCIPPHIDHHDFVRPFCTLSLLTECNIVLGSTLKIVGPGEFSGPVSIPLPVGSVFVVNGNGADVAKHCIPGVSRKRISITFRKMDDSKLPYKFRPDPELIGVKPLIHSPVIRSQIQHDRHGKSL